jgi:predicted MFS family arabinose efflux permease
MRLFSPFFLQKLGKKRMLRLGVGLSLVVTASCALASNVAGMFVFRVLQGFGFGMVSTICATLAADLLPDARRGEGIGYFGMGTTAMVAFSPALGLFVAKNAGFGAMFLVASAGQLLSIIALAFFSPPKELTQSKKDSTKLSLFASFFDRGLALQCALLVLFGICRSSEQNFLSLLVDERAINLSSYFIFQTAVSFVAKWITGRLYDKKGHIWSVLPGGVSILIALFIMSCAPTIGVMLIAGFFSGVGMGALLPSMQSWTITSVAPERRSVASASYYNFYDIGQSVGAVALGALAARLGYAVTFRTAACVMIAFLAVYAAAVIRIRRRAG